MFPSSRLLRNPILGRTCSCYGPNCKKSSWHFYTKPLMPMPVPRVRTSLCLSMRRLGTGCDFDLGAWPHYRRGWHGPMLMRNCSSERRPRRPSLLENIGLDTNLGFRLFADSVTARSRHGMQRPPSSVHLADHCGATLYCVRRMCRISEGPHRMIW